MDLVLEFLAQLKLALIITLVACGLEWWRPIDRNIRFRHALFNLTYLPFFLITASLLGKAYAAVVTFPVGRIPWPEAWWAQPIAVFGLFATYDFFYYIVHRLQHRFERLWVGHAFHHSDPHCSASTRNRTHWIEGPLTFALAVLPTYAIWQPPPDWAFIAITSWSYLIHANFDLGFGPLRNSIVGPHYHRIHHSIDPAHHGRNFASFLPFWDMLFRTHLDPGRVETGRIVTGLEAKHVDRVGDLPRLLVEPAWRSLALPGRGSAKRVDSAHVHDRS